MQTWSAPRETQMSWGCGPAIDALIDRRGCRMTVTDGISHFSLKSGNIYGRRLTKIGSCRRMHESTGLTIGCIVGVQDHHLDTKSASFEIQQQVIGTFGKIT